MPGRVVAQSSGRKYSEFLTPAPWTCTGGRRCTHPLGVCTLGVPGVIFGPVAARRVAPLTAERCGARSPCRTDGTRGLAEADAPQPCPLTPGTQNDAIAVGEERAGLAVRQRHGLLAPAGQLQE